MKKYIKTFAALLLALASAASLQAEVFKSTYTVHECQDYTNITEMLVGPGVALHPAGTKIPQTSNVQIGIFSNLVAKAIPSFTNGVILSTGKIMNGPSLVNESAAKIWADDPLPDLGDDADLCEYFPDVYLANPAGIVLYIQPKNKTINIPFVMASEEFYRQEEEEQPDGTKTADPDYPPVEDYDLYSDKFAFFLKKIASATDPSAYDADGNVIDDGSLMEPYLNIAQLNGEDVEIASVNQHTNSEYFISNVATNEDGRLVFPANDLELPMEFNGAIVGPVAVVSDLDTNAIYKLKIVIADGYDNVANSVVFLRERGITSGADLKVEVDGPTALVSAGPATYKDTVSNVGPATADGVEVTHYLPNGVDPASVTVSCDVGSVDPSSWGEVGGTNFFVWTIGDRFASGSNAVMTVTCTLPQKGSYTNVAQVVTSTGDYNKANDTNALVTVVGDLPSLHVVAITTNKVYGTEMDLSDLQFVLSIDGTNETQIASGIDVSFTDESGAVAYPTNAAAAVGTYDIVLTNIRGFDLTEFGDRIVYENGTLTIEKAAITITANDATKKYGEEKTFAGTEFAITSGSLAEGDSVDTVTLTSDGAPASAPYKAEGYPIEASNAQGTGLDNYEITYADGTLMIEKAAITIKANDATKKYGEEKTFAGTEFTVTAGTLAAGDAVTSVTLTSDGALASAPYKAEGYPIVPSDAQGTGLDNYEITYADGTLTIEKLAITIKANDATKKYGEEKTFAGTEFTITAGTLAAGDSVDTVTLKCDGAAASAPYKAEGYPIVPSAAQGTGLDNYVITYANGTLTIEKLAITITANDATKKYGEEKTFVGTEFAVTSGTLAAGDSVASVKLTSDGAPASAPYKAEGYPIKASDAQGAGLDNYEITYADGTLTMEKLAITITANDATKKYGEEKTFAGTEFTVTAGTLAAGDAVTSVTLASDGAAASAPYKAEGYPIKASDAQGTGLDNYEITYADGTLTIEKAAITIKANDATKKYGEEKTFAGTEFTVTSGTLAAGDSVDMVKLTSDGAPASAPYKAEGYPIVPSDAQGTGLDNYVITYADGTLTIEKLAITITANDATKKYGEEKTFAGTEFTITSGTLAEGDTVDTVKLTSDGAPASAPYKAEGYPIKVSDAQGTGLDNYEITYADGTLTIEKLAITITANDATKKYGEEKTFAGTEFTITSGTLAAGDSVDTVKLTSDGAAASAPYKAEGYPIVPSDAQGTGLDNYEITYADGTLTMEKLAITITANDVTKKYGEEKTFAGTEFTVTAGTLAAGDAVTSVTLASDGAAASAPYRAEGYPIKASDAQGTGLDNYEITYADGTLTIEKAAITIRANNATKQYGEEKTFAGTEFTITAGTLAAGDSVDTVTLTSDGAAATAANKPEGYPIVPSDAQGTGLDNYEITYANGTLTFGKRTLTITANDVTKKYGEEKTFAGTEFTVTSGTLAEGDTVTSVTLASDGAAVTAPYKAEGYPIVPSDAQGTGLENYEIVYANGTLTMEKAAITIKANDATKKYGATKTFEGTEFTVTSGALVEGDAVTSVTLTSDGAGESALCGEYPIKVSAAQGTGLASYEITYVDGTLTVVPLEFTVAAENVEKFYDTLPTNIIVSVSDLPDNVTPTFEYSYSETEGFVPGADFTGPTNVSETAEVYCRVIIPGTTNTTHATARIKPRIVVHHAKDGEWTFDGLEHTQPGSFEDADAEAEKSKAQWGTDEVLPNSTGFVDGEGYAADLVMTEESKITLPGTQPNVIDTAAEKVALKENTKAENYELSYLDGELKVTALAFTLLAADVEKFYDGAPANISVTVKGIPAGVTAKREYSYSEVDGYVPEAAFTGPTNVSESTTVWCRVSVPGTTNVVSAAVTIKPRIVVEHAKDATKAFDGTALTQPESYEDTKEEEARAKAKWGVAKAPANSTGFAAGEGFAAELVMTEDSQQTEVGTHANVIDTAAEKVALKANTKAENYEIYYLEGMLTVKPKSSPKPVCPKCCCCEEPKCCETNCVYAYEVILLAKSTEGKAANAPARRDCCVCGPEPTCGSVCYRKPRVRKYAGFVVGRIDNGSEEPCSRGCGCLDFAQPDAACGEVPDEFVWGGQLFWDVRTKAAVDAALWFDQLDAVGWKSREKVEAVGNFAVKTAFGEGQEATGMLRLAGFGTRGRRGNGQIMVRNVSGFFAGMLPATCTSCSKATPCAAESCTLKWAAAWTVCSDVEMTVDSTPYAAYTAAYGKWTFKWNETAASHLRKSYRAEALVKPGYDLSIARQTTLK